jgi:hypothetical protein
MGDFNEAHQNYLKLKELGLADQHPETGDALVSVFIGDCAQGQGPLLVSEPAPAGLLPEVDAVTTCNNEDEEWVEPWACFREEFQFAPQDSKGLFDRCFDKYKEKTNGAKPKLREMKATNFKADSSALSLYLYPKVILMEIFDELRISHPKHFQIKNIGGKTQ